MKNRKFKFSQRGMTGTYWRGSSSVSFCDYNNCNGAEAMKISQTKMMFFAIASMFVGYSICL